MKKIVSIINQKGGVGKTSTSINMAGILATQGYKVLLIDLDPQAHSTIGLGVEPETHKLSIHNILMKKADMKDIIMPTKIKNLFIAPSHIRLDKTEQELTPELFKENRLAKAMKGLDYDFTVIDCRPTLGTLTVNALYACNFIIVPCEVSRYSLDGFADLMETIDNVKNWGAEEKNKFVRILVTKYESRNTVSNNWVFEQLAPFKDITFKTYIRKNESINQAHMAQEPVFIFKPDSHGSQDYTKLTKEFLKLC